MTELQEYSVTVLLFKGLSHIGVLERSSPHDYDSPENVQNVPNMPGNIMFYIHKIQMDELCATAEWSVHEKRRPLIDSNTMNIKYADEFCV